METYVNDPAAEILPGTPTSGKAAFGTLERLHELKASNHSSPSRGIMPQEIYDSDKGLQSLPFGSWDSLPHEEN